MPPPTDPGEAAPLPSPALRERVAGLADAEADAVLLEAIRGHAADILGHPTPDAVEPDRSFLDTGFDSLTTAEFRERLNGLTGLTLPGTAVFDHPTPTLFAEFLRDEIRTTAPTGPGGSAAPAAAESLSNLFLRACGEGRMAEIHDLTERLAAFRPTFDGTETGTDGGTDGGTESDTGGTGEHPGGITAARSPRGVRLCSGPEAPEVVCLPSFVWKPSPHQYTRLAQHFRGSRNLSAIDLVGFRTGDPLPASLAALTRAMAHAVLRQADGAPFVLAGHSAGGSLAAMVAGRLEEAGTPPTGLVLLDSHWWGERTGLGSDEALIALAGSLMANDQAVSSLEEDWGDAWVTARARYFSFDFRPETLATPTLLLRATEPLPGTAADGEWRALWKLPHTAVDVPGDHFSMLDADHTEASAQAVEAWLADIA